MRRSTIISAALTLLASFALLSPLNATVIGDWPAGSGDYWENQPIPGYTGGSVTLTPPTMTTTVSSAAPKNATWLPYATYPTGTPSAYTGERMTTAGLILNPGDVLSSVHLRVYDPSPSSGRSGWAAILKDTDGNILDFGIRGFYAPAQIRPHQFDVNTLSWNFGATISRVRTGNNYYSMDFSQNPDGTINWSVDGWENGVAWANPITGTTTVTYGDLTGLYLNSHTSDTTGNGLNYRWTEFTYTLVPEPSTGLTLACGLGLWMFISRLRRR